MEGTLLQCVGCSYRRRLDGKGVVAMREEGKKRGEVCLSNNFAMKFRKKCSRQN